MLHTNKKFQKKTRSVSGFVKIIYIKCRSTKPTRTCPSPSLDGKNRCA